MQNTEYTPEYNPNLPTDIASVFHRITSDDETMQVVLDAIDKEEPDYDVLAKLGLTYDEDICPIAPFGCPYGELVAGDTDHIIVYRSGYGEPEPCPHLELMTIEERLAEEND